MLSAIAKILICPFCKGEKAVSEILFGHSLGGTLWSDMKTIYPAMPEISLVQRCPHCGKYYFPYKVESKEGNEDSDDQGNLTYEQIKEAVNQYAQVVLEQEDEIVLRLLFVNIYNDTFQREGVAHEAQPTADDKMLFRKQVLRLLQIWDYAEDLQRAELYREIGEFEQAVKILDAQPLDQPFMHYMVSQMRQLAESGQTYAFQIKYKPTEEEMRAMEHQEPESYTPDPSSKHTDEDSPF